MAKRRKPRAAPSGGARCRLTVEQAAVLVELLRGAIRQATADPAGTFPVPICSAGRTEVTIVVKGGET